MSDDHIDHRLVRVNAGLLSFDQHKDGRQQVTLHRTDGLKPRVRILSVEVAMADGESARINAPWRYQR